jgi:hypothetical protein
MGYWKTWVEVRIATTSGSHTVFPIPPCAHAWILSRVFQVRHNQPSK